MPRCLLSGPIYMPPISDIDLDRVAAELNSSAQDVDIRAEKLISRFRASLMADKRKVASQLIDELVYLIPAVGYLVPSELPLLRGRTVPNAETCYDRGTALAYPRPPAPLRKSRANKEGKAVVYATTSMEALIEELRPETGYKAFNGIIFRLKHGLRSRFIPIGSMRPHRHFGDSLLAVTSVDHIKKMEDRLRPDVLRAAFITDDFFAEEFARKDSGDLFQYELTACIAEEFYADERIDGIIFPSVKHDGSFNFTIKPSAFDDKFFVEKYFALAMESYKGPDLSELREYAVASNLLPNGQIAWQFKPSRYSRTVTCIPDFEIGPSSSA